MPLSLATSLSCPPQGEYLVCDLPQQEIRDAYETVLDACGTSANCPVVSQSLKDWPFVSTLQLWVEQYDPDGDDAFYSPVPTRLGLWPVGDDLVDFQAFHFDNANVDNVTMEGCRYEKYLGQNQWLRLLGDYVSGSDKYLKAKPGSNPDCVEFTVPTTALDKNELVLLPVSSISATAKTAISPLIIQTSRLRPSFGKAKVEAKLDADSVTSFKYGKWELEIPIKRALWDDRFELLPSLLTNSCGWWIGGQRVANCTPNEDPNPTTRRAGSTSKGPDMAIWQSASKLGRLSLHLSVAKSDLRNLPRTIHMYRGNEGVAVAELPDIRRLVLPSTLTVQILGKTVALQGENAGSIDAIALQNGDQSYVLTANSADDMALISLTLPSPSSTAAPSEKNPTISKVTILPPMQGKEATQAPQSKSSSTSPKKSTQQAAPKKQASTAGKALPPGTYKIVPLLRTNGFKEKKASYIPIDATGKGGTPLTLTIPAAPEKPATTLEDSTTTTIKITKSTQTPKKAVGSETPSQNGSTQTK